MKWCCNHYLLVVFFQLDWTRVQKKTHASVPSGAYCKMTIDPVWS